MNELWTRLKDYLIEHTGLAYYEGRPDQLARVLQQRMKAVGAGDPADYLAYLERHPSELEIAVARLTVGETYFFRNRPQFQALADTVFPDLLARLGRLPRIWSAGCSIGAEPYSIAGLGWYRFGERLAGLSILATDIDQEALKEARAAVYSEWALREMEPVERDLYLIPLEQQWRLRPNLVSMVRFERHNLVRDPVPPEGKRLDLIVCRNVLIYFDEARIRRVLERFYEALEPGGWLLVGHSEPNIELFRGFSAVNRPGTVLYRRPSARTTPLPGGESRHPPFRPPLPSPPSRGGNLPEFRPGPVLSWRQEETLFPAAVGAPPSPPRDTPPSVPPSQGGRAELAEPTVGQLKRLADQGRWREAQDVVERLLHRDPSQARVHFYRALVQEHLGQAEECERSLSLAIYLDRDDPLAHYYRGLAQRRRGATEDALRSFRTVVRLLQGLGPAATFSELEEVSVAELRALASSHLESLEKA